MSKLTGQTHRSVMPILIVICILVVGVFGYVSIASAQTTVYTVKSSDTIGSIALAHNVTVASLLAANPQITDPNVIFAGEQLNIPAPNLAPGESIWAGFQSTSATAPTAAPTSATTSIPVTGGTTTYTVQAGDTLGSIAMAHGVTVASILAANPSITNPNAIFAGEQISIPAPNLAPGQSIWAGFPSATSVPVTGATPTPTHMPTTQPTQTGTPFG